MGAGASANVVTPRKSGEIRLRKSQYPKNCRHLYNLHYPRSRSEGPRDYYSDSSSSNPGSKASSRPPSICTESTSLPTIMERSQTSIATDDSVAVCRVASAPPGL
mmetsp:Transcript_65182/g.103251  ORF Transcript_65182/g.103251 Transcript_65182/m.103251 type:complete len:105 (+) Transcript_65182:62-376(+)